MLFTDALAQKNSRRAPVWLMRQAGRYMHEYQALRKRYDFLTICHTPELICEVTHQPINAFGLDAAIVFSDILLILQALGFDLRFYDDVGPVIGNPLAANSLLESRPVVDELHYVLEGIKLLKKSLNVPLIGFAGAPFTVASYVTKTKEWNPDKLDLLLDLLADCTIDYLNAQIEAGCDAVQLFDSWAMHLDAEQFHRFSKKPLEKIVKGLKGAPAILFCRGPQVSAYCDLGAISVDWTVNMPDLRAKFSGPLQGNLDPSILLTDRKTVEKETKKILDMMRGDPAFIFNLGHGVHKNTPRDHVQALVDCVKSYS
ncbi:MAG: uroporphyrinogen decarboxylase [Verrucomicrobia bacterium]|nr:uroporphyrinogen decarboxylase [Verrucomicrobiota bacterium]MBS0636324.1 uroporphyrinogen decarboxylase [Verrucomicrobiota bacterium]